MNIDIEFFKKLYKEDIIYHYTKASTAINYILYKNQLRFNEARKSIDPIESKKPRRGVVYSDYEVDKPESLSQSQDANELSRFLDDIEKRFVQICFCQNKIGEDFASKNYIGNFKGHEEIFGFTKPRMWDQYADKFTGVCIAFSKDKILKKNKNILELIDGNIKYLSFKELSECKIGDIQGNYLANVGRRKYKEQLKQSIRQSFFFKHEDYSGENEYRIGTLFDKKKCCLEIVRDEFVFDRAIMLDISECIEAIFISSFANDRQKNDLLEYANKLQVEIIEMKWQHNSFETRDYRKWTELIKNIEQQRIDNLLKPNA